MLKLLTIWMGCKAHLFSWVAGAWSKTHWCLQQSFCWLQELQARAPWGVGRWVAKYVGKCLWLWASWLAYVREVSRCRFFSVDNFIKQWWQEEQPMTWSLVIVDCETDPFWFRTESEISKCSSAWEKILWAGSHLGKGKINTPVWQAPSNWVIYFTPAMRSGRAVHPPSTLYESQAHALGQEICRPACFQISSILGSRKKQTALISTASLDFRGSLKWMHI